MIGAPIAKAYVVVAVFFFATLRFRKPSPFGGWTDRVVYSTFWPVGLALILINKLVNHE